MLVPKLPLPTKPLTEGEPYCPVHMIAIENGQCVICEWAKQVKSE